MRFDLIRPGRTSCTRLQHERSYAYDPGGGWPKQIQPRLLGVQACLWSEKRDDRPLFDRIAFPRLSAIAESAWTPSVGKDIGRFGVIHSLMPGLNVE